MKILIVGVSGFIGNNIYEELSHNYDVFGISRNVSNKKNCYHVDLLNLNETKSFFDDKNFEVIIYLSSVMASSDNLDDNSLLMDNLKMQFNLIECIKNSNNCLLINFSSSAVYPNIEGEFTENSIIDPSKNTDCLYGLSKFSSETLFNYFLKNIDILNLRLGYVYGKGMNPTRIHKVFEKELKSKNTISVWGNGKRVIPQLSLQFLIKVLKKIIRNPIFGNYNLCEENISLKQLAERIIKSKGNSKSKIIYVDKGNKNKFKMNNSKLLNILK